MKDRYPNMDMNTAHLYLEKGRVIILNMNGCNEKDLKGLIEFLISSENMKPYWRFTNSSNFIIESFNELMKNQNISEIYTPYLVLSRRNITPKHCIRLTAFRSTDPALKDLGGTVMTLQQFYDTWETNPKE